MKNLYLACVVIAATAWSCNQPEAKKEEAKTETAEAAPNIQFAYTIDHPADNWSPGKLEHVATVLNALKAYETGDIDACVKEFADSVSIEFDEYEAKLSNDSLKSFFKEGRSGSASITIKMNDWESVISKDKKKEYVSLWYKEIRTDKNGKIDSVSVMDDLLIENGKIAGLDEKTRKYAKKKM